MNGPQWPMTDSMCASACSSRRVGDGPPGRGLAWLVSMVALAGVCHAALSEAPGLPEMVRTKHRSFAIPFRLPASQDPNDDAAAQRVVLNVSKDLGGTWSPAGETSPTAGSFNYVADVDGEYWFRLRAIDKKGRSRGGEGPDIRVLVDAAGPRLAARLWKGSDGEIICRYAAADDSLRLESLTLEYRGSTDRGWKTVAADAVLAREAPAHLVGEAIWWAGEKVDQMTVRITVSDTAGNQTVRQFSLELADPGIDQSGLAEELGLPPLPGGGSEPTAQITSSAPELRPGGEATSSVLTSPRRGGAEWASETARWHDGDPVLPAPARPGLKATSTGLLPRSAEHPLPAGNQAARQEAMPSPPPAGHPETLLNGSAAQPEDGQPQYRGRPLHFAASRRFVWDYEVPAVRRTAGPLRAELWTTRDGGITWQRTAVDKDAQSPIDVEVAVPGLYGVRLELVANVPDADAGPRSGAEPDAWLGIDEEPPQVELIGVEREEAGTGDAFLIRYAARDPLLAANTVRLLYSPNAEGPWATIATGVANEGEHRWEPARNVPARVYVRAEATDAAGNVGTASSEQPFSVAPTRFGGRLGGLRVLPRP